MSIAQSFVHEVTDGPLLFALPVAAAAGLVSFLSPCVLPLVPGYLSYVTSLTGRDLATPTTTTRDVAEGDVLVEAEAPVQQRGRVLAGSVLFVLGFSAVFVLEGAFFGRIGAELAGHQAGLEKLLGVFTVVLGLGFLGLVPAMQREVRFHRLPRAGLVGALPLGALFGLGWSPCLGPTLGAVQTLAITEGTAGRGAILTGAYCLGLGIPFVLVGLAFKSALGAVAAVKRHYGVVQKVGGALLVVIGLLLVSGLWEHLMIHLRIWAAGSSTSL